jgi:hypothetical protein
MKPQNKLLSTVENAFIFIGLILIISADYWVAL